MLLFNTSSAFKISEAYYGLFRINALLGAGRLLEGVSKREMDLLKKKKKKKRGRLKEGDVYLKHYGTKVSPSDIISLALVFLYNLLISFIYCGGTSYAFIILIISFLQKLFKNQYIQ